MKACLVTPTYFSDESLLGGGERYIDALSRALSKRVDVDLVSFGRRDFSKSLSNSLSLTVYRSRYLPSWNRVNPLSLRFLHHLLDADVIHCAQPSTLVGNIAVAGACLTGRGIFATELGGGGVSFRRVAHLDALVTAFLTISKFAARNHPPHRSRVIYAGVDRGRFHPWPGPRGSYFLYVGRVLPHKGVDYLIEALPEGACLKIVGGRSNPDYEGLLSARSKGKRVEFIDVPVGIHPEQADRRLAELYSRALATVLPSVYVDVYGRRNPEPELLGLVLLESQACKTPVICTGVGGMPEVVENGRNGFVVPPNDSAALGAALRYFMDNPGEIERMGGWGMHRVWERFTWDAVAWRCLLAYKRSP